MNTFLGPLEYLFIINSDWFVMLAGLRERERERVVIFSRVGVTLAGWAQTGGAGLSALLSPVSQRESLVPS